MGTSPTSTRLQAAALTAGACWGALLLAALETTRIEGSPTGAAFAAAATSAIVGAAPALVWLLAAGPVALLVGHLRRAAAAQGAVSLGFAALLFGGMRSDDVIAGHPAVWGALALLVAALTAEIVIRIRWPRAVPVMGLGALAAGVATWFGNYRVAPGVYFEAHWALGNLSVLGLGLGAALLVWNRPNAVQRGFMIAGGSLLVLGLAVHDDAVMRRVAADTEIGRARMLVSPPDARARATHGEPAIDVRAALHEVRALDLPAGFDLGAYDVLFVATEAIRRDDTTLQNASLGTTPNLVRWRTAGAFDLTRGYAPSAGTLQSLASWFALTPVACAELDIYKPHWAGRLRPEAETAAEMFRAAGRHTFWIGHNFRNLFGEKLFGFEQGFELVQRTPEPNKKASEDADDRTGDAAAAHIRSLPTDRRFFGYVMFSAPHYSYVKHYEDMPSRTARDRYRQEIRKADEQLGKLFDALQTTGRLDRTIVILTADHGEEFGDHGATGHNRTLYEESIHVPLLVWLPGARALDLDRPVSTAWLLPWLMLHDERLAGPLSDRLRTGWGPLLAALRGHSLAEIVRGQQTIAALIGPQTKLHVDVAAGTAHAFDLHADPREQTKRFELSAHEQQVIDAFGAARSACEKIRQTGTRPPKTDR